MSDYQPPTPTPPPSRRVPPVQPPYQPPPNPTRPKGSHVSKRTSGKAIGAFFLGLMSMGMWLFTGFPAIVMALSAKKDIKDDESLEGNGLANFGIFLGGLGFFVAPIALLLIIIGVASSGDSAKYYDDDGERIVHLHLSGGLSEAPVESLFGSQPGSFLGLLHMLEDIEEDPSVVAMVITLDGFSPSMAHMEEIHNAIAEVVESGTDVYVHSEDAMMSMPTYVMLSSASHMNVVPTGFMNLSGMYSEGMYLKDGLAKIGLEADIVHIGEYKSAGETMMLNGPSKEAQEATNWLLDSIYTSNVEMIAAARQLDPKVVRSLIDVGPYTAEKAEKVNLIDTTLYQDDLLDTLKDEFGNDIYIENQYSHGGNAMASPFEELLGDLGGDSGKSRGKSIGVVFVEGNIMPGFGGGSASSGNARKALEEAANDRNVKAVVLRVNSPGGSVTASEVIWRAAELLNDKKPLVVSMGGVAASGGYYISCGADTIYADATTITGSIGVVGGKIVTSGLWDELGVNWHSYQRGGNSDWSSTAAPFNQFQRDQIVEQMGQAYTTFKDHVIAGRGDKLTKDIEDIAAGRVFTGKQAKELGLVDEIGGLNDAIEHAAELADLGSSYYVRSIPRVKSFSEIIEEEFFGGGGGERPTDLSLSVESKPFDLEKMQRTLGISVEDARILSLLNTFDPERSQEVLRMLQCAELLKNEGVLVMMPNLPVTP